MDAIQGMRGLIVEDNSLIGEVIAETITEAGDWPLGPVLSEQEALDMIDYNPGAPDAAILDLHLDGTSFSVAERLRGLGIPFIFASGNFGDIPEHFRDVEVCPKPYTARSLLSTLQQALSLATR